jgi:hypothetical protein
MRAVARWLLIRCPESKDHVKGFASVTLPECNQITIYVEAPIYTNYLEGLTRSERIFLL